MAWTYSDQEAVFTDSLESTTPQRGRLRISVSIGRRLVRIVFIRIDESDYVSSPSRGIRLGLARLPSLSSPDRYLEARLPGDQTATTHPIVGWKVVT